MTRMIEFALCNIAHIVMAIAYALIAMTMLKLYIVQPHLFPPDPRSRLFGPFITNFTCMFIYNKQKLLKSMSLMQRMDCSIQTVTV